MIITKQQSRVLLASIQYCKEQGMDDDWMEGYLIQEIEYLSKLHQPTVISTFCEKCNPNGIVDGNIIKCKTCGRGLALIEQNCL